VQHAEIYLPVVDRHFQVTNLPIRNQDGSLSMLSIYRDITDNRDQARRLRATEEDYRRLFEHAGAGVYISSKEGKFLDANAALLEMLGYRDKAELLRMNLQRDLYVRPEDRFKFQQLIERDGRVIDYEVDFKRKDGSTLPVLLTSPQTRPHLAQLVTRFIPTLPVISQAEIPSEVRLESLATVSLNNAR